MVENCCHGLKRCYKMRHEGVDNSLAEKMLTAPLIIDVPTFYYLELYALDDWNLDARLIRNNGYISS